MQSALGNGNNGTECMGKFFSPPVIHPDYRMPFLRAFGLLNFRHLVNCFLLQFVELEFALKWLFDCFNAALISTDICWCCFCHCKCYEFFDCRFVGILSWELLA